MTRAVVDSSVLVSALITPRDTPPSQLLRAWARERFELIVSPQLISELAGAPGSRGHRARDPRHARRLPRRLAKAAGAVLVSSDRDVLEADIDDLEVVNAREFLDRLA